MYYVLQCSIQIYNIYILGLGLKMLLVSPSNFVYTNEKMTCENVEVDLSMISRDDLSLKFEYISFLLIYRHIKYFN